MMRKMMKRLVVLMMVIAVAAVCMSCSNISSSKPPAESMEGFEIAVIKTSELKRSSYIEYYDDNLELLSTQFLPYACLNSWELNRLVVSDGTLYTVETGLSSRKDSRTAISLNLESGSVKEYKIDQINLQHTAASGTYFFTTDNLNNVSHITRCDVITGETKTVEFNKELAGSIVADDSYLYSINLPLGNNDKGFFLKVFNMDLDEVASYPVMSDDSASSPVMLHNDDFYFMSWAGDGVNAERKFFLNRFSSASKQIDTHIATDYCPSSFVFHDNLMIISHLTHGSPEGNYLSVFDLKDDSFVNKVDLGYEAQQLLVRGDTLYVMGLDEAFYGILAKYSITGSDITLEQKVERPREGENDPTLHYLVGIFLNPNNA
jgi:hypothetical protein